MTPAVLSAVKKLGMTDARFYLAARSRLVTPLGAAEYLKVKATHEREAWDARVKVCLDCMELYRALFPVQYAASASPYFSTAREQEFYRLVNEHMFPLCVSGDRRQIELEEKIDRDPNFFLPAIPVSSTQQHDWRSGCCPFTKLQTVFQLVLVLSGHPLGKPETFVRQYGLDEKPAPPLAAWGWQQFLLLCGVHDGPLRFLPAAFDLVCYSTGTAWLDIPPEVGVLPFKWRPEVVSMLFLARQKAERINSMVLALNSWLNQDPAARVRHAVKLWNAVSLMEEMSGFKGMSAQEIMGATG